MRTHTGWYLCAFISELPDEVNALAVGPTRLVAVRSGGTVRVFGGSCPHRGAHLGHGGTLDGGCIICPFHGKRITLGDTSRPWSTREYTTAQWGDAVFVRLSDEPHDDRGFTEALCLLADSHPLRPALTRRVAAPPALIVENAFDADHFTALHKVSKVAGMQVEIGTAGELAIEGEFIMQSSPWQGDEAKAEARFKAVQTRKISWDYRPRFFARAFSPGLVVTEFGPPDDVHVIVTAAVPVEDGAVVRVAVGVRAGRESMLPMLIAGSHKGLAEDIGIWENMEPGFTPRFDAADRPVVAFGEFCAGFGWSG